jgi:hypothetical protein
LKKNLNPLFISNTGIPQSFTTPPRIGGEPNYPERNISEHGNKLVGLFNDIISVYTTQVSANVRDDEGFYVDFIGAKNHDLTIQSLENLPSKIRLSNIKNIDGEISATIFLPKEKQDFFLNKINQYLLPVSQNENPKFAKLVNSIEDIKLSAIKSFWNGSESTIPREEKVWCEVWLINQKNAKTDSVIRELTQICETHEIEIEFDKILKFQERLIVLANINKEDILKLINFTTHLSEIMPCSTPIAEFIEMYPREQSEWTSDLVDRTTIGSSEISVCILDTGVYKDHPLLKNLFTYRDAVNPLWRDDDHKGHGTEMAGLSVYGETLPNLLLSSDNISINYDLSSIKILPRVGDNRKELWGNITKQAVAKKEIFAPSKKNIYCMAVTAPYEGEEGNRGNPTSWAAAVDDIMYNQDEGQKLFLISAGNINIYNINYTYFSSNNSTEVQEPAQSWNALTVGAYTRKIRVSDDTLTRHTNVTTLAKSGEISPYTSTTITWENGWPNKPDIVFEGGNCFSATGINCDSDPDLSLLTTNWQPGINQFTSTFATSAATALATNFTANLYTKFPHARAETIRALIIHSADWTEEMIAQYSLPETSPSDKKRFLLKSCGYGIPNFDKAINCYSNSLTLICEDKLQPYHLKDGKIKTNEMKYYELPWPKDALLELGASNIKMKVTLSYFIEPSPGNVDDFNLDRYRYSSHGLRFDINHPDESKDHFLARKNEENRNDTEYTNGEYSSSGYWEIGSTKRDKGSVISDTWVGTAAELASSNYLCIYPIMGWWKSKQHLKDEEHYNKIANYSLIISIYSEDENIDIYTPVKVQIETPVEVPINIEV